MCYNPWYENVVKLGMAYQLISSFSPRELTQVLRCKRQRFILYSKRLFKIYDLMKYPELMINFFSQKLSS